MPDLGFICEPQRATGVMGQSWLSGGYLDGRGTGFGEEWSQRQGVRGHRSSSGKMMTQTRAATKGVERSPDV